MILFENLFKPGQLHLAVDMLLTSSVLSATSKQCFEQPASVPSTTLKQCFEQPAASTTSKQCFEQPATSFLIDALIFIAYNQKEKFSPEKHIE
ncbi:S1 RNA-binding domain-containing protein [Streptococcus pneumoniae]|nr:S1 RNA-binding domain-containing protein [Streptococcus pneumoniae]